MKQLLFVISFLVLANVASAQRDTTEFEEDVIPNFEPKPRGNKTIRLVFYNVENLFDVYDDTTKNDDAFTPKGDNKWSERRYNHKLQKTAKTLIATGGWEAPEIIGLCEVENKFVVKELCQKTVLRDYKYEIVHHESGDKRGIDVAMIYRPDKFEVLHHEKIVVKFPEKNARPTRDILYVKGIGIKQDTLHIFINHWPSRYGGHLATDPKRMLAAKTLKAKVDSIYTSNPKANIVLTGDFNDHPEDNSIIIGLEARHDTTALKDQELFNLMYEMRHTHGTHKFAGEWGVLDMWIISTGLIKGYGNFQITERKAQIFKAPWLLEDENVHLGKRPFRTYQGPKYIGGFSDHMPIILDLKVINKK